MPMPQSAERRALGVTFGMTGGYVLDFTDRTMAEWFEEMFGIDIASGAYNVTGTSKAKRLRAFIEIEDGHTVGAVLRALWTYAEGLQNRRINPPGKAEIASVFAFIDRIEGAEARPRTDALERFKRDETLDELIAAIGRDIAADRPAAALDRLHLYCMKKFAHLLDERGIPWDRKEPLHSRVGKYMKALERERELRRITIGVLKGAISVRPGATCSPTSRATTIGSAPIRLSVTSRPSKPNEMQANPMSAKSGEDQLRRRWPSRGRTARPRGRSPTSSW